VLLVQLDLRLDENHIIIIGRIQPILVVQLADGIQMPYHKDNSMIILCTKSSRLRRQSGTHAEGATLVVGVAS